MPPIDNIINYKKQKNKLQKNKKITIFFQKRTKYNIFQKHFIVNIKIILSFGIFLSIEFEKKYIFFSQ